MLVCVGAAEFVAAAETDAGATVLPVVALAGGCKTVAACCGWLADTGAGGGGGAGTASVAGARADVAGWVGAATGLCGENVLARAAAVVVTLVGKAERTAAALTVVDTEVAAAGGADGSAVGCAAALTTAGADGSALGCAAAALTAAGAEPGRGGIVTVMLVGSGAATWAGCVC